MAGKCNVDVPDVPAFFVLSTEELAVLREIHLTAIWGLLRTFTVHGSFDKTVVVDN